MIISYQTYEKSYLSFSAREMCTDRAPQCYYCLTSVCAIHSIHQMLTRLGATSRFNLKVSYEVITYSQPIITQIKLCEFF